MRSRSGAAFVFGRAMSMSPARPFVAGYMARARVVDRSRRIRHDARDVIRTCSRIFQIPNRGTAWRLASRTFSNPVPTNATSVRSACTNGVPTRMPCGLTVTDQATSVRTVNGCFTMPRAVLRESDAPGLHPSLGAGTTTRRHGFADQVSDRGPVRERWTRPSCWGLSRMRLMGAGGSRVVDG